MNQRKAWLTASIVGLVCIAIGAFGTAFAEEDIPLTDGTLWRESSHVEKTACLVSAGNFLTVEYVVQQQSDTQPTEEQSSVRQYWDRLEDVSLDELIDAVDNFYQENPDKLTVPVLVVIWNSFVETD